MILTGLGACSTGSVVCSLEQTAVTGISTAIGVELQCSNVAAIKKDLDGIIAQAGICKQSSGFDAKGKMTLPSPICSIITNLVAKDLAKLAIPTTWGCTAQNATNLLGNVVMTACLAL